MSEYLAIVDSFLRDARMYTILGLILLDVVLAVARALKEKRFEWFRLADFYQSMILPFLIGYLALYVLVGLSIGIEGFIGQAAVTGAFGTIVLHLVGSIAENAKAIGLDGVVTKGS